MVRQRVGLTLHIIGSFLKYFALAYIIPLVTALYYGENWQIFLYSLLITLAVGLFLQFGFKTARIIERSDGFTIVAFTWLLIPLFGTLPYLFLQWGFIDAFFEAMSGFTTTGATILSTTGSEGFFAVLPRLTVGGSQLFDREFPGPLPERLRPRFSTTARLLWTIYVGFTGAEIALLHFLARVPFFDSICISFATIPTGGFTPTTGSIEAYITEYPLAQYIIMFFMFLAGMSFILHYQFFRGKWKAIKNEEFRLYIIILAVAILLLIYSQGLSSYREGVFQAISIMTTTGFVTADFGDWHGGARIVLLALMFIGACGASTGGAIKVVRFLTLIKHTGVMMRKAISPKAVIPVKLNLKPLQEGTIRDIISFIFLYVIVAVAASIVLVFLGLDLETSISAVAATLGNVGPGLGGVGPTSSYAGLTDPVKVVLTICMWLGRLELFTAIMIFSPRFWKG
jgi:trk system potassium uptake protein TrkH